MTHYQMLMLKAAETLGWASRVEGDRARCSAALALQTICEAMADDEPLSMVDLFRDAADIVERHLTSVQGGKVIEQIIPGAPDSEKN